LAAQPLQFPLPGAGDSENNTRFRGSGQIGLSGPRQRPANTPAGALPAPPGQQRTRQGCRPVGSVSVRSRSRP